MSATPPMGHLTGVNTAEAAGATGLSEAQAVASLAALAQETRLRLFKRLLQAEPVGLTPGELGTELGIAGATLSFHLKELSFAGLVTPLRQGRHIHYRVNMGGMNGLMDYLTAQCCSGQPCGAKPGLSCPPTDA